MYKFEKKIQNNFLQELNQKIYKFEKKFTKQIIFFRNQIKRYTFSAKFIWRYNFLLKKYQGILFSIENKSKDTRCPQNLFEDTNFYRKSSKRYNFLTKCL